MTFKKYHDVVNATITKEFFSFSWCKICCSQPLPCVSVNTGVIRWLHSGFLVICYYPAVRVYIMAVAILGKN